MGLKPKNTRRPDSSVPQAATTIASTWTPSVDSATAVLPAGVSKNMSRKCMVCMSLNNFGSAISFHEMDAASRTGCQNCSLLVCVLRDYGLDFTVDNKAFLRTSEDSTLMLQFDSLSHEDEVIDLFILEDSACPWPDIRRRKLEPANSNAELSAVQITQWLEDCSTNHSNITCGHASASKPLPTRLLQIIGHQKVRLYTPSSNERGRYVCLSHCWGGSVAVRTTRATELQFHDRIDWDSLPRTFQDAVDLTWRLGLEYLWIDSLCILQDDLDDWRHEGSKMASVYSSSFLTLAATKSANGNGGFYTVPDLEMVAKIHKMRHENGETYTIHSRRSRQNIAFSDARLPLLTRAWAFQERILSSRVVHFADEELIWECTNNGTCECGLVSSGVPHNMVKSRFCRTLSSGMPAFSSWDWKECRRESEFWYEIVSSYSALSLTFRTDTLPALQGIVKRWQLVRDCSYYAGLWEGTLMNDLLWYYEEPDRPEVRIYQPPSWSWASRGGRVGWWRHRHEPIRQAQVLSISVTPKGLDPTGEVSAGVLIMRGRRVKTQLKRRPRYPDIKLDRAVNVEFFEVCADVYGYTSVLCLRSIEPTAAENDQHAVSDIPTFERIGMDCFWPDDVAKISWSEESTVRLV